MDPVGLSGDVQTLLRPQYGQGRTDRKLVARFEAQGTEGLDAACTQEMRFTADEWKSKTEEEREQILQNYRLAFRADTMVNWCPQLGTVLANAR